MKIIAVFIALLALFAPARSVAAPGDKLVYGVGTVSCAEWQKVRTTNDRPNSYQAQAWVDGYLSGSNAESDEPDFLLDKPQAIALYAWIDNYCSTHPLDYLLTAVWKLKKELLSRSTR